MIEDPITRLNAALEGEIQDLGKQIVVFRKQSNGGWLASAAIFNSDLEVSS